MSVMRPPSQIKRYYATIVKTVQRAINMTLVSKNKDANELFAIINWAEFRRRLGSEVAVITKHAEWLKQLVYTGETKIRRRGKFYRIRTPVCPPLSHLMEKARGEQSKETSVVKARVPPKITLELRPKSNAAWHRVTDISHNPHLRLNVKCGQSLSTVIEMLERKWIPSAVRSQRALADQVPGEWDKLPYIRLYPSSHAKLQPFDLSLCESNSPPPISFDEYLKLNHEDIQCESTVETNPQPSDDVNDKNPISTSDPVKFLKDKLQDITTQIKGEVIGESGETKEGKDLDIDSTINTTKSHEWITQSATGWTVANSKSLSMGAMHLLFDRSSKVRLEYEWPELETDNEVVHMFAGMINKLINLAQSEFAKKKLLMNTPTSPNTNRSPSTRGRRASPATPKSLQKLVALKPAPSKDSPEFKKPGVPLQSENKQLADAIALGRQELLPYARRLTSRPKQVIQKNLLPKRLAAPVAMQIADVERQRSLAPRSCATSTKTHVMDVSCITGGKYSVAKRLSTGGGLHQSLKALITKEVREPSGANPDLSESLSRLINSSSSGLANSNPKLAKLQSIMAEVPRNSESGEEKESLDLLEQAMNAINSPMKKRRITPTLISPTVEGMIFSPSMRPVDSSATLPTTLDKFFDSSTQADSPALDDPAFSSKPAVMAERQRAQQSDSQMSLNSLLRNIGAGHTQKGDESICSDISLELNGAGAPLSFQNLIPKGVNCKEQTSSSSDAGDTSHPVGATTAPLKDAWLTPDVAMTDFSLSSLLGDKSPRRAPESVSNIAGGMLLSDRPSSTIGSDDTRLSFLNRLDVGDLGMGDTGFSILANDSVDYMINSLDTPQKKPTSS
ncbi:uncharacterized protein [Watersipora subatra]